MRTLNNKLNNKRGTELNISIESIDSEKGIMRYSTMRTHERERIRKYSKAPVEFSTTNHYIKLLINGAWETFNGWTKEEYLKEVKECH